MTIDKLHEITTGLVSIGKGQCEVAINLATFHESENGAIIMVDDAAMEDVQGADDSGPVGPKFPTLVIVGEWPL